MISNIQRAMMAESALCAFDVDARSPHVGEGLRAVDDLYEAPETVAADLITNLCHFLNLDERAGCYTPEAVKGLLDRAYNMFVEEHVQDERGERDE